jgi:hypothetical protein
MKTTRNLWPFGIVTAFVLFVGGMASFVVIACSQHDYLVNANYYENELEFQSQLDGAARAQQAGAAVRFDVGSKQVVISVPVAQLPQKFSGTVELYNAIEPKADREFLLAPRPDGTQTLDVSRLVSGSWTVRAKWNAGGEKYFLEQKIKI